MSTETILIGGEGLGLSLVIMWWHVREAYRYVTKADYKWSGGRATGGWAMAIFWPVIAAGVTIFITCAGIALSARGCWRLPWRILRSMRLKRFPAEAMPRVDARIAHIHALNARGAELSKHAKGRVRIWTEAREAALKSTNNDVRKRSDQVERERAAMAELLVGTCEVQ